jgi:hypothetical protein
MLRRLPGFAVIVLFLLCTTSQIHCYGPPFTDAVDLKSFNGDDQAYKKLTGLYRFRINTIPYLLVSYLDNGSLNTLHTLKETMESMEAIVEAMGKTIANDREKETFAKLLGGSDKLHKSVERNIRAIKKFRRLKKVYSIRARDALALISAEPSSIICPGPISQARLDESGQKDLERLRAQLLKIIRRALAQGFRPTITSEQGSDQGRIWDETLYLTASISSALEESGAKEMGHRLTSSVRNLNDLTKSLRVSREEINQSWDEAIAAVESMEAVTHNSEPKSESEAENGNIEGTREPQGK